MKWSPLFEGNEQSFKTESVIDDIAVQLSHTDHRNDSSLLIGAAGEVLFWEYYYLHSHNVAHHERALALIDSILDSTFKTPSIHTFCSGISGVAWMLDHFRSLCTDANYNNPVIDDDVDDLLINCALADLRAGNYDFLHGGGGVITYLMSRVDKPHVRKALCEAVECLAETSANLSDGIAWRDMRNPQSIVYDLGLAHGLPSVMIILSHLYALDINRNTCKRLLDQSYKWLLKQELEQSRTCRFSSYISETTNSYSRLAWCYGDLGIAIALLQCGSLTNNPALYENGIRIALSTTLRTTPALTSVVDACLCHGLTGIAHIYNRLYYYTRRVEFEFASKFWFEKTLNFYMDHNHFMMLKSDNKSPSLKFHDERGLLEGYSGVGLALLGAISRQPPRWDRSLLLS